MTERLYSEKYRPKEVKQMILTPRLREELLDQDGNPDLTSNLLMSGTPGTGKTTFAKIVESRYHTLHINASLQSSVDDLKTSVLSFCQQMSVFADDYADPMKIVFLDEFDGVSRQFQEGLRGFIEEYEMTVRFIATCNNMSKISPAMKSRFRKVDFDPKGSEAGPLRQAHMKRIAAIVKREAEVEEVDANAIASIVNANFPDMRAELNATQRYVARLKGGNATQAEESVGSTDELYGLVTSDASPQDIYDYVLNTWGDKVDGLIAAAGRPFAKWIFDNRPQKSKFVVGLSSIVREHEIGLASATDPALHAMSLVYECQKLYQNT